MEVDGTQGGLFEPMAIAAVSETSFLGGKHKARREM